MRPDKVTRIAVELTSILSAIATKGHQLVCFDFGGTLFDFTPLHIRAFLEALKVDGGSPAASTVEHTVRAALVRGLDSFEMARRIATTLSCREELDIDDIVIRKRSLIEDYLKNAKLEDSVCQFLVQTLGVSSVAVISLGHVGSMKTVLKGSLGDLADKIAVYGRHSAGERVEKSQLLRRAIKEAGVPQTRMAYVGDAEVDESIALELGIDYIRVRSFLG